MNFVDGIRGIVKEDERYADEAYYFVSDVLAFTQDMVGRKGHVSGQELLEGIKRYAMQEYGYMARVVLESWGIRQTEDIGEIVFNMVDRGLLGRTDEDTRTDFSGGFDFRKTFDDGFRLELVENDDS
jgi:uncharacterized repeat protein (TIGR04138 family)